MISKKKWIEVIKDFHEKGIPGLIERKINVPKELPLRRAISIIGPRRVGKTYTMFQVMRNILNGKKSIHQIMYINFERSDLEGCNNKDLIDMMEIFYEIYPQNRNRRLWFFLGEIQNIENWEKFVRTIIDNENVQVFISGSSSKLLSKEIATSMRGRTISYKILPFSFIDYLILEKIKIGKYFSTAEKYKITNKLRTYFKDGGYPEVALYSKEKEKILQEILETTIYRDVIERYKIRNIKLLKLLIKSLINSVAREFSVHKFYNFVKSNGMKASKDSLYNYIDILNDVFLVFPLRKFAYSYKEKEQSLPKIYLIDNGILAISGINEHGKLMENMVFIELMRREKDLSYYKSVDGKEVDFVVLKKNKVKELIQVCFSIDNYDTKEREIKALLKASRELKCKNLLIITDSKEDIEVIEKKKIKYIPLWKWLLKV